VPLFALLILDQLTMKIFGFTALVRYRLIGAMGEAFVGGIGNKAIDHLNELTPFRFLFTPGLWVGLLLAAAFLAAAVRLRRNRGSL
jgi:ABC-2 type transport system permease protein